MRTVRFSAIALVLAALASAAPAADLAAEISRRGAAALQVSPAQWALKVPRSESLKHAFTAKQAATCDQTAFADATARVLQACPSLAGLVSGSTAPEEFLPTFCGSECYNVLGEELPKNVGCLDESTLFLLNFVNTCKTRPQCYSSAFVGVNAQIAKECGHALDAPTQLNNLTAAAIADARTGCSNGCVGRRVALMRQFPECIRNQMTDEQLNVDQTTGFLEGLCSQEDNEYCAVTLKSFGRINCQTYSNCMSGSNSWCTAGDYGQCTLNTTLMRMGELCGPCTKKLLQNLGALGEQAALLGGAVGMFCQTADGTAASSTNPYCYPVAMNAVSAYGMAAQSWDTVITNATVAGYCANGVSACVERTLSFAASTLAGTAYQSFASCVGFYNTTSSSCVESYEQNLLQAGITRAMGRFLCSQNANFDYCAWRLASLTRSMGYDCDAMAGNVTAAGCCLGNINTFLRASRPNSFPSNSLPSGPQTVTYKNLRGTATYTASYTFSEMNTMATIPRSMEPVNMYPYYCSSVENSTAFWESAHSTCPLIGGTTSTGSVDVYLAFARVNALSAAAKTRILQSMAVDVSGPMGVAPSALSNLAFAENPAKKMILRAATSARRQSAGDSGSSTTFTFTVNSVNSAAAVERLNTAVTAGEFVTPNAAAAVEADCSACLDARATSFVQASESNEVPTPAPKAKSGAAAVSTLVVAVAAIALAL